jgi:hypothetical protein
VDSHSRLAGMGIQYRYGYPDTGHKKTGIYLRPSLLRLHPHLSAMKEYLFWKWVAEFLLFILPKN